MASSGGLREWQLGGQHTCTITGAKGAAGVGAAGAAGGAEGVAAAGAAGGAEGVAAAGSAGGAEGVGTAGAAGGAEGVAAALCGEMRRAMYASSYGFLWGESSGHTGSPWHVTLNQHSCATTAKPH
jgi:hypothetical protein